MKIIKRFGTEILIRNLKKQRRHVADEMASLQRDLDFLDDEIDRLETELENEP
jgi:hypothetical protein